MRLGRLSKFFYVFDRSFCIYQRCRFRSDGKMFLIQRCRIVYSSLINCKYKQNAAMFLYADQSLIMSNHLNVENADDADFLTASNNSFSHIVDLTIKQFNFVFMI